MPATIIDSVELVWDLARERPTLGGALVLRQEGEIMARRNAASLLNVHLISSEKNRQAAEHLAEIVFASSAFLFQINYSAPSVHAWPSPDSRSTPGFSYFGFSRLLALYAENDQPPRLAWNATWQSRAQHTRARFSGRLFCVHLRSVPPFLTEESNADGPTWDAFFATHARPGSLDFLLLGNDPLPIGLTPRSGVSRAIDLGLDLATQLALVGCADGFLGMASGLCTAANLSDTPHVIFKHPVHHADEMARELGDADRFAFAGPCQRLWRRECNSSSLDEALTLISA